ncbi:MAG: type II toxin-antitoxin system prevent-host-death family antitoxin [Aestuariivirga sp.]
MSISRSRLVTFTTSDLSRKSGDIIAEALRAPVTITQRRKPRLVLMNIEEFKRLTSGRADTRKVHRIETMPDELFAEAQGALKRYESEGEGA